MAPGLKPAAPRKLKHPYASIEHRVMDSPAYADLSFSAQALLFIIARQLNGSNNGQLQATFSYCKRYGFGSEHTLRKAISELLTHGLICRTRSHGANGAWARYAVTWQSIGRDRSDLFLDGFVHEAWKQWRPQNSGLREKAPRKKCRIIPAENAVSSLDFRQKVQEPIRQKMQTMN